MGILQIVVIIAAFCYECICLNDSLDNTKRFDRNTEIRSKGNIMVKYHENYKLTLYN